MAEQGNCTRLTRAAKKRAAADENVGSRKRVVLGEIQNLSNVVVSGNPSPQKQKSESNTKVNTPLTMTSTRKKPTTTLMRSGSPGLENTPNCEAYVFDIYGYLHKLEMEAIVVGKVDFMENPKRRPLPDYISKVQNDINASMRGILVDWLIEVSEEYKLVSDTLYLSISYIDRFLSVSQLNRQKLQLLGVSAMLVASKYEEITSPHVEDFCDITDNTYTKEEVVKMEAVLLKALNFELGNPTIKTFLRRLSQVAQHSHRNPNLELEFLAYYLAELSLLEYNCVKFTPSLVAASSIFLARFIIRPKINPWSLSLQKCSGYNPVDLKDCVLLIHDLYLGRRGASLVAAREKYKQHKFKCVAIMASPPEVPVAYFGHETKD